MNVYSPDNYFFNIYSIPVAVAALFIFVFALGVFIKERASFVGWLFVLYASTLFFWQFGITLVYSSTTKELALFWSLFSNTSVIFIPPTFLLFSAFILNQYTKQKHYIMLSWLIPVIMLLLAKFTDDYILGLHDYFWGYYIAYGDGSLIFLFLFSLVMAKTLYLYWHTWKTAPEASALQKRSKLLFIGFSIGLLGSIDFLTAYGVEIYPMGFVFIMTLIAFSAYVVWHHKFADITPEVASGMILEAMSEGLVVLDSDNIVRVTNNAACQLLNKSKDELLNKNIKLAIPQISFTELKGRLNRDAEINDHLVSLNIAKKGEAYLDISARLLFDKSHNRIGYLYVMHDITSQYQAERVLQKGKDELERKVQERTETLVHALDLAQQASTAKSEFVSIVSHELRTPLTSIVGSLGLALSGSLGEVGEKNKDLLLIAQRNANRLSLLINDILDIQKIESGSMEFHFKDTEFNGLMQMAVDNARPFANENNVAINTYLLDKEINVSVDQDRIVQVINNLLSNAIKFSPKGSSVDLKLEDHDDKIEIHISDHGPGVPVEDRQKIFEKFTQLDSSNTRKHSGTGLGLNITRMLVAKHGGDIMVKDNKGGGSIFSVVLPKNT